MVDCLELVPVPPLADYSVRPSSTKICPKRVSSLVFLALLEAPSKVENLMSFILDICGLQVLTTTYFQNTIPLAETAPPIN